MDKEFVPYEQALALKELGFDEPCLAHLIGFGDGTIENGKYVINYQQVFYLKGFDRFQALSIIYLLVHLNNFLRQKEK